MCPCDFLAGPGQTCMDVPWWKAAFPDPGSPGAGSALGFLLLCLGICGAALLVRQCLATLAAGFGPSPCQVLAHHLELDKAAGAVPAGLCVGGHARCPSPSHCLPWRGSASPWPLLYPSRRWKEPEYFFFHCHTAVLQGSFRVFFPFLFPAG